MTGISRFFEIFVGKNHKNCLKIPPPTRRPSWARYLTLRIARLISACAMQAAAAVIFCCKTQKSQFLTYENVKIGKIPMILKRL